MTPFEIEILIHYYVSPTPHRVELENSPIWPETRAWFLAQGLLAARTESSRYGATYECTKRGEAWINYICQLPLPTQQWVMETEEVKRG